MLTILYQDRHIVVCVKPSGVLSQDAGETSMPSLLRQQLHVEQIYVIHRLDREVGGVMVYGLSQKAAAALSRAVQERKLEKTYLAVLRGIPAQPESVLEDLLFHDKTRNKTYVVDRLRKGVKGAKLEYQVLAHTGDCSLAKVRLYTGRTHQIRVQFASRKLPLVGDGKYGDKDSGSTLGLWSWQLTLPHPVTAARMMFSAQPPGEMPWTLFEAGKDKQ